MKIKKNVLIIIIILIIIILIIINIFKKKSYEVEYSINDYNITENYNKEEKRYLFTITNDQTKHSFYTNNKYNHKHKLISEIETLEEDDEQCLLIKSSFFETNPLCTLNEKAIDFRLTSEKMQEKLGYNNTIEDLMQKYNNTIINNPLDYTYLIWNYRGFNIINKDSQYDINILSKDQYSLDLVYLLKYYLVIPDYNSEYNFNKFYILNIKNGKKEEIKIKYDISFDSCFIGHNENSVYLIDKKNKKEYELVPSKKKIRVVSHNKKGLIYENGEAKNINMTKLINDDIKFEYLNQYKYQLIDNNLYLIVNDNKTLVSNNIVKDIVYTNEDIVLYLVEDNLYTYDLKHGEVKTMSNFEWNFNYKNLILLYNP